MSNQDLELSKASLAEGATRNWRLRRNVLQRARKLGYRRLTFLTGPMGSGKSAALISHLAQYQHARRTIRVFTPGADSRTGTDRIASRQGTFADAITVCQPREMLDHIPLDCDIVAVDEVQLFADSDDLLTTILLLIEHGIIVLAAGLDLDFASRPFPATAQLCALADQVEKLTAICARCGSAFATRTQRLINGRPAPLDSPAVIVEGTDTAMTYEARCHLCYEAPRVFHSRR